MPKIFKTQYGRYGAVEASLGRNGVQMEALLDDYVGFGWFLFTHVP